MSNNYIKIEMQDSIPYISMEYEDLETFKNLVFFMMSKIGSDLFYRTIENELLLNGKKEELKILEFMSKFLDNDEKLLILQEEILMSPSSFS